jgi:RNA 2',3'-cyclic 3'-phosphodiesterase
VARARPSEDAGAPRGRRGRPGSPRARLFVALDPAEPARRTLGAWRDELIAGRDDLRPVRAEALHVTLAFLGYRPEKEVEAIAGATLAAAAGAAAPVLSPLGVRPLPPRAPRLFALDLRDEEGRCGALAAAIGGALAAAGFYEPEKRPFWPHMTIARVKRGARAAPLSGAAELPPAFAAPCVVLYRSVLRPDGARYEPLARVELEAAPRG